MPGGGKKGQQGSCEGAEAERHHDATRRAKAAAAQATKSESK